MSSSSSTDKRPAGNHRVPRKGGRTLKMRLIRIESDRREQIDLHYLGQALLRLAQEQYDLERGPNRPATSVLETAAARPHAAHVGPNAARGGTAPNSALHAHTAPRAATTG